MGTDEKALRLWNEEYFAPKLRALQEEQQLMKRDWGVTAEMIWQSACSEYPVMIRLFIASPFVLGVLLFWRSRLANATPVDAAQVEEEADCTPESNVKNDEAPVRRSRTQPGSDVSES
jgi:hypothetical protein